MLNNDDHEELVRVMMQAAMEDGFEFNVVESKFSTRFFFPSAKEIAELTFLYSCHY